MLAGEGRPVADAVRSIGVTETTYYCWRSEYGGLKLNQVHRLKVLEQESGRPRNALASLTLEKPILKEGLRETTERCASSGLRGARLGQTGHLGAPCPPRAAAASLDAVLGTEGGRRRGSADFGDY